MHNEIRLPVLHGLAGETDGNILYCDEEFMRMLYEAHEDYFADESLVKDIGDIVLDNITTLVPNSGRAIDFV